MELVAIFKHELVSFVEERSFFDSSIILLSILFGEGNKRFHCDADIQIGRFFLVVFLLLIF